MNVEQRKTGGPVASENIIQRQSRAETRAARSPRRVGLLDRVTVRPNHGAVAEDVTEITLEIWTGLKATVL